MLPLDKKSNEVFDRICYRANDVYISKTSSVAISSFDRNKKLIPIVG